MSLLLLTATLVKFGHETNVAAAASLPTGDAAAATRSADHLELLRTPRRDGLCHPPFLREIVSIECQRVDAVSATAIEAVALRDASLSPHVQASVLRRGDTGKLTQCCETARFKSWK